MELKDFIKRFEEKEFNTWMCPIIHKYCDHQCYGYLPKGLALLLKHKGGSPYWTQRFSKSEDIIKWSKTLKVKVTVTNYIIYKPTCQILDSVINFRE